MNQRAARRLLAHALVWGTFVLAVAIHLIALPYGVVFPNLYAVPLLGAALVWPPRAVIAFLALTVIAIGVSFLAVGAPTTLERVRLVGLVLIGGLTIQTARLRVAAEAAGRARDDFVAAAAHDLKNPLTVIRGEAQHLRTQLERQAAAPVPADVSEPWGAPGAPGAPGTYGDRLHTGLLTGLGRIDRAAGHTLALLNGLLDVVRFQAGQSLDLVRQPTDLVALVERVAATYQAGAEHDIVVHAGVPALVGQWDAFRLERVVENLLSNAIKYSPAGGEITLHVRPETRAASRPSPQSGGASTEAWAVLTVTDRGIGIPAADLRGIFRPYQRGRNVTGRVPGMGIGLTGARQIVAQHGGTIVVASREGNGSTFTVLLPIAEAAG